LKKNLFLPLLFFCLSNISYANSHVPTPLRFLIENSDLILVGKVISTKNIPHPKNDRLNYLYDQWEATVHVVNVVEGDQKYLDKSIRIKFEKNIACAGSAEYGDSLFVLSFLKINEDGTFQTLAGSYGVKNLNEHDLELYKQLIRAFRLAQENNKIDNEHLVDWLISCLKQDVTSWEGAYELSPHQEWINGQWQLIQPKFSTRQLSLLRNTILESKQLNYSVVDLLHLIYKKNDPALLKFIANQIDTTYSQLITTDRLLTTMTDLVDDVRLSVLLKNYKDLIASYVRSTGKLKTKEEELVFQNKSIEIFKEFRRALLQLANEYETNKEPSTSHAKIHYLPFLFAVLALGGFVYYRYRSRNKWKN